MEGIKISFTEKNRGKLLADAELTFTSGPMEGLKLVGFSVWQGDRGLWVAVPAKSFGQGEKRGYFYYLRAADTESSDGLSKLYRFKAEILKQYRAFAGAAADTAEPIDDADLPF